MQTLTGPTGKKFPQPRAAQSSGGQRYAARMSYAEFAPLPALAPFVRCVWMFEAEGPGGPPTRIVPDGRPELVIHCGDRFCAPFASKR